jgi:hypothetical protein
MSDITNFDYGISSFGVPVFGGAGFPSNAPGKHFWVDSVNGDDSNNGKTYKRAKKSISAGYALMTTNHHDVLHVVGGATAYTNTAVLTFDKDYCHVIAHTSPIFTGGRARITNTVTSATAGEFVISGTGCTFAGLHFQWGDSATATSVVGVALSGNGGNAFLNCSFDGPVNATVAGGTAIRNLTITSSQDNYFGNCSFGGRTILSNSAAGALVSFNGTNNSNNVFENCIFNMYNSTTTSAAVSWVDGAVPTSGWTLFRKCTFMNHTAVAVADVIRNTTTAAGMILLDYCAVCGLGTTVWATNLLTNIFTIGPAGNEAGGIAIVQT